MNNTAYYHYGITDQEGLTLVELMLVISVLVILVIIALPTYQEYVERSDRANAIAEMTRLNLMNKTQEVKNVNSGKSRSIGEDRLEIDDSNVQDSVRDKYRFAIVSKAGSPTYRIYLIPKLKHYKLSAWMSSNGDVYECRTPESAQRFATSGDCVKKI